MFKVKNSKVIGKISRRSLKSGKTRNIIAVAAIILTAVMFTALFTVGMSVIESFQLSTMRQVGTRAHGGFKFITWQQYEKIAADPKVKDISYSIIIGTGENPELKKVSTEIRYTEEKEARWCFNYPTTGTLPKNRMDVATTTEVLDALGVPHELGASVPLEFTANGKKYRESFTLCGWWENDVVLGVSEVFLSREYADEVAPVWQDGQEYYDYKFSGSVNPSLYFPSSWDLENQMSELKERCGFGAEVNDGINWAYMTKSVDAGTVALIVGMLTLIMLSGYLVIYNIFYISVNGRIRFYGLLKTIGTTNGQLKRIVRREALLLSAIGIPLGLAIGYALSAVIVPAVIGMTSIEIFKISANPLIFIGSGIFALITVWISCAKPCRLVCRISPVEAVRYTADASVKKKRKRTKRVTPFILAAGNIGRTRKKTAAVVLSLSLALILLNATVSLTHGFDMDKYLQDHVVSDFYITDASVLNSFSAAVMYNSITPEVSEQVEALDGVTDTGHVYMREYEYKPNDTERRIIKEALDDAEYEGVKLPMVMQAVRDNLDKGIVYSHIYGVDGLAEDKLIISEGEFDREKFESGNYVIAMAGGGYAGDTRLWKIGDKVTLDVKNGQKKEYEIMALGNINGALDSGHGHGFDIYFTLPSGEFTSLTGETGAMNIAFNVAPDKINDVDKQIKKYCENVNTDLDYRSRQSYVDEFKDMQNTFMLVGSLLSFILALIGILNFINAIVTSIRSRRQEFAVLQSIGMTGGQLKQMLVSEGAYYIIFTALFTLTLGSLLTYVMMTAIENVIWYFSYRFIITPVLVVIPIMLVLAMLIPVISYARMCRRSVVERLREVNE